MRNTFEIIDPAWEQSVHKDFIAMPIREGEPVIGHLSVASQGPSQTMRVWRLSPAGVELVNTSKHQYTVGQTVTIRIDVGQQITEQSGSIVRINAEFEKGPLLGIVFNSDKNREQGKVAVSTRAITRWQCHPIYFPTGFMKNPGKFADKIFMRVLNISRAGMLIATSLRNKYLLRGMQLQGTLTCPMAEPFSFTAEIISSHVKKMGSDSVNIIGLSFINLKRKYKSTLGAYIAGFGSNDNFLPSPARLKKEGYGTIDISDSIAWDYVRTKDDYDQVLHLRRIAYRTVEGWPVDADDHLISDDFDQRSRIVIGKYRDQVVATLRVCFHRPEDTFEEELYIKFPSNFPARDTLVEASRAATHPDFRGSDLFMNMMRFTMLTSLQGNRPWIVQSTYDYLSPIYDKLGFTKVGDGWMHPQLTDRKMQMFVGNIHYVLNTKKGNPFAYQALVPHIESFLKSDAFDKLSVFGKLKMQVWKRSAPAYKLFVKTEALRTQLRKKSKLITGDKVAFHIRNYLRLN